MNKRMLIIIVGVLIVLVIGVGVFLFQPKNQPNIPAVSAEINHALPKEVSVNLTDKGFSPNSVTIEANTAVRFVNNSSSDKASVNSDDYPNNKKFPELNLGTFKNGSTLVHIFTKTGTYTYHNQFNPNFTGTIIVQ